MDPAAASPVDSAKEFGGLGQHCEPALLRLQIRIIMKCLLMHSDGSSSNWEIKSTDSFFIIMDATMIMMNDQSFMTLLMITITWVTKI